MAGWTFENALAAIQRPPSIPFTILLSMDGLRLGDIHFAKIQMTLGMQTVSITVLEKWVESGCFNPECKSADDCSHSTAILIVLTLNQQGTLLTYASIGLVRQRKGPLGQIEGIPKLIAYTHSQLGEDRPSSPNACKTYCIIVGDYGGSMGFATEPPFCMAYPLSFANRDDPTQMTFWHPQNHPCSFTVDVLLVHQLLARDCSLREYERDRHHRCLLIPRGVHFSTDLFPQIIVPQGHVAPFSDPQSGVTPPIFNVGPFASMDTLFPSAAGDLDLFTDMEISGLVRVGLLNPPITGTHDPHAPPPASKVEPASSSRK